MAKAKNSGRRGGGIRRVRKTREVKPDGAHAYTWTYQAKIADALHQDAAAEWIRDHPAEFSRGCGAGFREAP